MNPQLQIKCSHGNRDASLIVAAGIPFRDSQFQPRGISVSDLPPDLLEVWHAYAARMEALESGGRFVTFAVVDPGERVTVACAPEAVAEKEPILHCTVSRTQVDGSADEILFFVLDDTAALYFFEVLTSPSFWTDRGIFPIQQGYRHFQFQL